MKVIFLGTGSSLGVPVIGCHCEVCRSDDNRDKRLRSSVLVEVDNTVILIDASPDFRYQMLNYYNGRKIDAVLITHAHRDHVAGLDDLRPYIYIYQNKPIDLFAQQQTLDSIKLLFFYSFEKNRYPGSPIFTLHKIDNQPFYINNVKIIPIKVLHGKLEILGFRINDFTYITDAKYIPKEEISKIKGTKILVINALRRRKHYSHFSLSEAIDFIKLISPDKAYLTHIGHFLGLHKILEKELPSGISPAYDGLDLEVD